MFPRSLIDPLSEFKGPLAYIASSTNEVEDWSNEVELMSRDFIDPVPDIVGEASDIGGRKNMPDDYLPASDAQFNSWQTNLVTYANANLAGLGLVAGDLAPLVTAQTAWTSSYSAHITTQAAAQAARQLKDANRLAYEAAIRALVNRLQASASVSDPEREALSIPVRDKTRSPIGVPTSRPVGSANTSQRLRITVAFVDELSPTNRAKPAGVFGCEVWVKIGGVAPTDLSECTFLALDTRSPYTAQFDGEDANQTAHFVLRWANSKGEAGPISETISATIPG